MKIVVRSRIFETVEGVAAAEQTYEVYNVLDGALKEALRDYYYGNVDIEYLLKLNNLRKEADKRTRG